MKILFAHDTNDDCFPEYVGGALGVVHNTL